MRKLLLTTVFAAALPIVAHASTDLHLNTPGSSGTDPVLLNENQTVTLSDTNASTSAKNIDLIFAVPVFSGIVVTAPTIGSVDRRDDPF